MPRTGNRTNPLEGFNLQTTTVAAGWSGGRNSHRYCRRHPQDISPADKMQRHETDEMIDIKAIVRTKEKRSGRLMNGGEIDRIIWWRCPDLYTDPRSSLMHRVGIASQPADHSSARCGSSTNLSRPVSNRKCLPLQRANMDMPKRCATA
jgi:hypothetical protein